MPQLLHTPYGPFHCWHDIIARTLAEGRFWDAQIKPFIDEADPSGWAIDLGANIGFFTCYMAKLFEHVIAVEAHPQTHQLLTENLTEHGVREKVSALYPMAAYDRSLQPAVLPRTWEEYQRTCLRVADPAIMGFPVPDEYNLDSTDGASSIAFVAPPIKTTGGPLVVPTAAVDDFVPARARVTFIKCDVQGCDLRALKGLRATIERCRPLIVFEFEEAMSGWHGDAWQDYLDFFTELNYNVSRISDHSWDYVARAN